MIFSCAVPLSPKRTCLVRSSRASFYPYAHTFTSMDIESQLEAYTGPHCCNIASTHSLALALTSSFHRTFCRSCGRVVNDRDTRPRGGRVLYSRNIARTLRSTRAFPAVPSLFYRAFAAHCVCVCVCVCVRVCGGEHWPAIAFEIEVSLGVAHGGMVLGMGWVWWTGFDSTRLNRIYLTPFSPHRGDTSAPLLSTLSR